jgi:ABC-type antimicrobial peptide transport system ATPase subunit
MASYYLPNGVTNPNSFNWNNLNTTGLRFYSPNTGLNWASSWNQSSNIPYSSQSTQTAAISAANSGNQNLAKVLSGIVTYGPALTGMISQIILATKGRSINNPAQMTDAEAAQILQYANGSLNPATLQEQLNRQTTSVLGIPISYIAVGLGGLLVYQALSNKNNTSKK